jgi:hypothetical protein
MNLSDGDTECGPARSGGERERTDGPRPSRPSSPAERLFAERGVEAVSLREVAKAATSPNAEDRLVLAPGHTEDNAVSRGEATRD